MSGVYISGMEMPKYIEPGLVIEFADGIDGKRYARLHHYIHGGLTEWLEAIPVPDHGRLGDLDKLEKDIDNYIGGEESRSRFHHWVQVQDVVIPMDKGEEK